MTAGRRTLQLALLLLPLGAAVAGETADPCARHPLVPPDTSSPRATLQSFLDTIPEFEQAFVAYRDAPSRERALKILRVGARAVRTLDLSAVPPAAAREMGGRAAVLLQEVLARIELPTPEEIPGVEASAPDRPRARWTIPGTEITIARVGDEPRAGEFLFSADTIARLDEFYEAVQDLPYLRPMPIGSPLLQSVELTGWLIPPAMVAALPSWSRVRVFETPLWKLLASVLVVVLAAASLLVVHRWVRPRHRSESSPAAYIRRLILPLGVFLVATWLGPVFILQINLQGSVGEVAEIATSIAWYLAGAWASYLAAMLVAEWAIASPRIPDQGLDAHLLRLTARVTGLVAASGVVSYGARDLGIPVAGVIAGLGVGGLAVALAAQSTIGNLLGSLNLFADRPVRVGDFCRYGDQVGTIEEIGIRSSRIRGIDRTVTTVPNAELAQMAITNYSRRDRILFQKRLDLRYETTPDQLRLLLIELREMLVSHPRVGDEPLRVRLVDLASSSIQVEVFAYVRTSDWSEFLDVQQDLLLRIIEMVNRIAAGFAFPAKTEYAPRDPALDAADASAAQAALESMRAVRPLPLPQFDPPREEAQ
jgi:MscS family membrane protein